MDVRIRSYAVTCGGNKSVRTRQRVPKRTGEAIGGDTTDNNHDETEMKLVIISEWKNLEVA
jgi:hypothetical protein